MCPRGSAGPALSVIWEGCVLAGGDRNALSRYGPSLSESHVPPSPPILYNALCQTLGPRQSLGSCPQPKQRGRVTRHQLKGLTGHPCGSNLLGCNPLIPSFQSPQPSTLTPREGWSDPSHAALTPHWERRHQHPVLQELWGHQEWFGALCRETKPKWGWQEPPSPTGLPGQGCGWATQMESYFSGTG